MNRHFLLVAASFVLVTLVLLTPTAVRANAFIDGTLNFSVSAGSAGAPTPTGSFVYDSTTKVFTSYAVLWNGVTYDFATPATIVGFAAATNTGFGWCAVGPGGAPFCSPALPGSFSLPFDSIQPSAGTFILAAAWATGPFTITETTVPEPSSMLLLGTGLAAIAGSVRRKLGR